MKCPHYKICISFNSKEHLCNDSSCILNIKKHKKELTEKKQSVKHKIVRQFETSYDYATDEIIKLKEAQAVMLKNKMQNFDLNKYRENVSAIEDFEKAQADVKKRYVEFFGEEMKR